MSSFFKKDTFITTEKLNEILASEEMSEEKKKAILLEAQLINFNLYKQEIEYGKKLKESRVIEANETITGEEIIEITEPIEEKEVLDVTFYLNQIKHCKTKEELHKSLPSPKNDDFLNLINMIIATLLKECIAIENLLAQEKMDNEDKECFMNEIKEIQKLVEEIKSYRDNQKQDDEETEIKNNLIYLTSFSGNYYALGDIKNIDNEYYDLFLGLLNSIINGTFKNVKKFKNNNKIDNLYEVKDFKTRIIFDRVDFNTYIILGIFVKKTQNDQHYRNYLENRNLKLPEFLKQTTLTEEYLQEQENITKEILEKLKCCEVTR